MKRSLWGLIKIIRYLKDKEVKLSKKLLFFVPVLYLLFPFDLIGDFFPLAGQLDDVVVFIIMWPILKKLLSTYTGSDNENNKTIKRDKDTVDINKDDYEVK